VVDDSKAMRSIVMRAVAFEAVLGPVLA